MFLRSPLLLLSVVLLAPGPVEAGDELLVNGAFEDGLDGWGPFWSRSGDGQVALTTESVHQGKNSVHIHHSGDRDWSFPQVHSLDVQPGDIFELRGWIRIEGEGRATLSVILQDAQRKALSWSFGGRTVSNLDQWHEVRSRFVVPHHATMILPRLMGFGPAKVWLDGVSLVKTGTLDQLETRDLPETISARNEHLTVSFRPSDGTMSVTHQRSGKVYRQHAGTTLIVLSARRINNGFALKLLKPDDMLTMDASIQLEQGAAEFVVELRADGEMSEPLSFPSPFATESGQFLIMPVNEGISYPVDDESLKPMNYHLFGGHGLCMAFWGITDLERSLMAIVETPDDARVGVPRIDDYLCLAPQWLPQKNEFGPPRRIRFVLLGNGGYVAMCKRYRRYAQSIDRFKTLAQKRSENPNVDRLVGAVNVWCWDKPASEMCRELKELGIERILWSNRSQPEQIRQLNEMSVLTSRYDIYQDVMDPANFPKLHGVHPDWTTGAWPNDLILREDGATDTGWRVKGKDGQWYPCGVLCDSQAVAYAKRRIPEELKTHPYACRFIDTTTAAHWRECFHPKHPMTRSDSRRHRVELLQFVNETCGLVTGSETGHDAAVPYVHYFEGMLSLGPYRVPDAGRRMMDVVTDVPQRVAKFQTGHYYRLPLWELVYHDCVVAQWYWGDYNNKLPALWDRRDLLNALYGTPPMFMFNRRIWRANRDRFLQSYQMTTPIARATGYSEMLAHRWLTDDHTVQQTRFANDVVVTVNFGDRPFAMADGRVLDPMSRHVEGVD